MSKEKKKRKKDEFIDDGRTIANMNVEGMPWYIDEAKRHRQTSENGEVPELTKEETRAAIGGMLAAVLVVGLIFAAIFLIFILFCVFVWFR